MESFRVFLIGKNIQVGIKDEEKESFPGKLGNNVLIRKSSESVVIGQKKKRVRKGRKR